MNKILILGGTGMVGKNLQDVFKKNNLSGYFIGRGTNNEYNLLDYKKTNSIFKIYNPETVVFLSAKVGGIGFNRKNPATLIHDNLQMGINVLNACVEFNIKNLYITSTCCSYPKNCPVPFKENDMFDFGGKEESSNRPYGFAKKTIIVMSQSYRETYGLNTTCFILANLYGKYDHFNDLENSHVVPALIEKFIKAKEDNLPEVKCWGQGIATRDLFECEDLAEILSTAIKNKFDYSEPINLGTGKEISIRDLAALIKELVGYQGHINFTGEVSDGQPRRCLDVSRARALLNWEAKTDLRTGLIQTIEWYKQNRPEK